MERFRLKLINRKHGTRWCIDQRRLEWVDIGRIALHDFSLNRQLILWTNVHDWGITATVGDSAMGKQVVFLVNELGLVGKYLGAMATENFMEYNFYLTMEE